MLSLPVIILAKNTKNGEEPLKKGETPLSRQFNQIKAKYPGAILLFRVGDFYETFGEDAVKASKILGIVLTRRNNGNADDHLAGFPHHSLDTYLPKLVRAGQRVAICDQLEDPALAKGIVKRGVTELVTPGVSFNDQVLDHKRNNYVAALSYSEKEALYVSKENRVSLNRLTKYELVRILGERINQLTMGAKPLVKNINGLSYDKIAEAELLLNMIPFKIKRPLPNGMFEIWALDELHKDHLLSQLE